jgi:hypothetical protein
MQNFVVGHKAEAMFDEKGVVLNKSITAAGVVLIAFGRQLQ